MTDANINPLESMPAIAVAFIFFTFNVILSITFEKISGLAKRLAIS